MADSSISKLKAEVANIDGSQKTSSSDFMKMIPKLSTLTIVFLSIPLLLLIMLSVVKPSFVTYKDKDDDGNEKTKLSLYKLIIITVVISVLIPACYYGYILYSKK